MINIFIITCLTLLVALLSQFIQTLMQKWGILGWLQSRANPFFYKMLTCSFCRSFWLSVIICLVAYAVSGYVWVLVVPIFVAPIGGE